MNQANRRETLIGVAAAFGLNATYSAPTFASANKIEALPYLVPARLHNAAEMVKASDVALGGWLGNRVTANAKNRLLNIDTAPLLAGFIQKPGSHPWIGEHIGKWLNAATLAWANNGDEALHAKITAAASQLIAAQEEDGYLGTYIPSKRFGIYDGADWDVWSHKYCLMGLLTFYRYSRDVHAFTAAKKAADLLIATFPSQKSILSAGTHEGMAATSVLEPIVLLYRLSAEEKYLDFAKYIVASWSEPNGPNIVTTLLTDKKVNKTANGKAYEMLSNLVGLSDLARVTGDNQMIEACRNAWQDIVDNQLHITGSTSRWEHFQKDGDFRCDVLAHIGETCVTTTWIQFNQSLLQLTGEARFGDELERSFYNHLAAAQHPDGDDWCYYTALQGRKQYDQGITCCHSSGPRGMALAPLSAILLGKDGDEPAILINSFESLGAEFEIGGNKVKITQESEFPRNGKAKIFVIASAPTRFALKIRAPNWAQPFNALQSSEDVGWRLFPARTWDKNDVYEYCFNLSGRIIEGVGTNLGREAVAYGPYILAADQQRNAHLGKQYKYALAGNRISKVRRTVPMAFSAKISNVPQLPDLVQRGHFKTFADAGSDRGDYRVWLRARGRQSQGPFESVLIGGQSSWSRRGNSTGDIIDDDLATWASTNNASLAAEDWFMVELAEPKSAITFVFNHGRSELNGGWFDTSVTKPIVEIKRTHKADWEEIGRIDHYPSSNSQTNPFHGEMPMWDFRLDLREPVSFVAVRVRGAPASGNNPRQNYVTCTQLSAFDWL